MRKPACSVALVLLLTVSGHVWAKGSHGARRHGRRGPTALVARHAPPAPPPVHPDSVGSPNEGRLIGGVHLDTSRPDLRVVPSHASGDVRWGLPGLVRLVERAAAGVAKRYPGSVLEVGDLSRKGGGEVARHHSHESGRDADLGFYVVDAKGKQIHAHGFLKIDAGLHAAALPGARFDLGRNWALVEMLVTNPGARVSHIFIAEPLRQALLAQGRARGVSQGVLDRAAIAMMQPHNSLPHDDHMHVRISCPNDAADQCVEYAKGALASHARSSGHARAERRHPTLRTPPRHRPAAMVTAHPLPAASPGPTPVAPDDAADPVADADAAKIID